VNDHQCQEASGYDLFYVLDRILLHLILPATAIFTHWLQFGEIFVSENSQ